MKHVKLLFGFMRSGYVKTTAFFNGFFF